jgi:hypothetical protein
MHTIFTLPRILYMYVKAAGTIAEICVMQVAKQIEDEFMSALLTLVDCYSFKCVEDRP